MLPPGPSLPPALQLLAWLYRPASFFDQCHQRYGDVFTMRLPGHAPRVMLARHDAIRAVFTGDPACLHAGKANALVAPLVGPRSVLILDGAAHQRQRRTLLAMFSGRRVPEHSDTMRALTDDMIDAWPMSPFRLQPEMQALTLRIIVATLFGARSHFDAVCRVAGALLEHARSPLLLVPALQRDLGPLTGWRRFQALSEQLDALLAPIIAERRAAPSDRDLLGQLVSARDEAGQPLSDRGLRDELVTLLVAGHETTASALAWTLQHILRDDVLRERLAVELTAVIGERPVRNEHLDSLPLLGATIDEGMRLNPVLAHVGRELTAPMTVGGYHLPAGCMVVPNIYLAHRDPAIFPEPTRFDPDRFLAGRHSPHAYFPFGGGARRCIGMGFALQEMKIVIATVLQRTRLTPVSPAVPTVSRRGVVWAPAGGVPVTQLVPPRRLLETRP